jgi:exodeoxyribonuclease VII large subunit
MSEFESDVSSDAGASKVSSSDSPWPVARLSLTLKEWIDRLGLLWVEGEIAQISLRATNMFGELRDLQQENAISIHAWDVKKIPNDLKQGDRVVALLKPTFWPKNGKLSMQVFEIRKVGLGELLERIERLRAQLTLEGLTLADRKVPLPFLPNKIGLITGKDSDAEKDVLQNAKLRWPYVEFRIINTLVQGEKAVPEIIAALQTLDEDPAVDVIIIARGGGAFLDLVIFSDEGLVRAVAAAKTPVVSAIGHEADRPILDDVADLRASTPTDAAKRVVPDINEERTKISQSLQRIFLRVDTYISTQLTLIEQYRSRPSLANPYSFIDDKAADLEVWVARIRQNLANAIDREDLGLGHLRAHLRSLSPQSTLDRGYAVIRDEKGQVLADAAAVKDGQKLSIRLAKGELEATANRAIKK